VPTAGERRGKAAVGEFFRQVAENVTFFLFEHQAHGVRGRDAA